MCNFKHAQVLAIYRKELRRFKFAKIKFLPENELIGGSLVMIVGSTFVNFANYIYHLLLGRMLGPVNYGTLNSLIAIFYLLFIPSMALATVITKFTSVYKAKNDYSKLYSLFRSFSEKILVLGVGVFFLFILARNSIADFLNIAENNAVVLVGPFFALSLLSTINNGILQGLLNFNFLSANNVFSSLLKVGFGFLLVSMGLSVNGAILAILISYILPYFISLYPLRFLWRHKPRKLSIDYKEIFTYAGPTTFVVLGMTSLYSTDIILVKHFFPSFEAGVYAAMAVVGKIIFFASSAIGIVMFPIISERFEKGSKYRAVLYQAFSLVAVSSDVRLLGDNSSTSGFRISIDASCSFSISLFIFLTSLRANKKPLWTPKLIGIQRGLSTSLKAVPPFFDYSSIKKPR